MSAGRTVMLGNYYVDFAGALLNGLPGPAFMKKMRKAICFTHSSAVQII